MTQRTEAEIRAEIELCQTYIETAESNIHLAATRARRKALTWVLSASPSPVAGDDEIVEAMAVSDAEFDGRAFHQLGRADRDRYLTRSRAALDVARPLIERAARAAADAEIAELRASLAKAEEDRRDALDCLAESQLSEQELTQAAHDLDLKIEDLQAEIAELRARVAELAARP